MLRILDPGIEFFSILDPGSASKEFKYFNPKKWFLSSLKYDLGCSSGSWLLPIPGPGSQIRIRNTVQNIPRYKDIKQFLRSVLFGNFCQFFMAAGSAFHILMQIRIKRELLNADPCGSGSGSRESHSMRILVDTDPDQGRTTQCGSLWIRIPIKGEQLNADHGGSGSGSRESHSIRILVDPDPDEGRATQCGSLWTRIRIKGEPFNADPCGSGSGSWESHSTRILVHPDLDLKHCKQWFKQYHLTTVSEHRRLNLWCIISGTVYKKAAYRTCLYLYCRF